MQQQRADEYRRRGRGDYGAVSHGRVFGEHQEEPGEGYRKKEGRKEKSLGNAWKSDNKPDQKRLKMLNKSTDPQATKLQTTFTYTSCTNSPIFAASDSAPLVPVPSTSTCYTQCAGYLYAILYANTGDGWMCKCAMQPVTMTPVGQCYGMSYYVYQHPASASGLARRKRAPAARHRCPAGLSACALADGFECLDTMRELGEWNHGWADARIVWCLPPRWGRLYPAPRR